MSKSPQKKQNIKDDPNNHEIQSQQLTCILCRKNINIYEYKHRCNYY